jgi:hypothetical protein|tara:strand:- start:9 stop:140 length:132 start_codon:yes stop_codon:yes gene_type:complete
MKKELNYYMYQFSDGTFAPFELKNKIIIGIWKVYNSNLSRGLS